MEECKNSKKAMILGKEYKGIWITKIESKGFLFRKAQNPDERKNCFEIEE